MQKETKTNKINSLKHEGVVLVLGTRGFVNGSQIELEKKDVDYLFRRYIKETLSEELGI